MKNSVAYTDNYAMPVLAAGQTFIPGYAHETHRIHAASPQGSATVDNFGLANTNEAVGIRTLNARISRIVSRPAEPNTQIDAIVAEREEKGE